MVGKGQRSESGVPIGIAIFLIADIRGYTSFVQERGDQAGAELIGRFSQSVRDVVQARGGRLIELRGDEALVTFHSPREAIKAAIELQQGFRTDAEPGSVLPVGIGLDAGEAVPVEGGYRGGALNVAARLCSAARAGEILASKEVTRLAGKLDSVRYADRGEVPLKGLAEPVRVVCISTDAIAGVAQPSQGVHQDFESGGVHRVIVADDSTLFRQGVARLLAGAGFAVLGQAGNAEELLELVEADPPDVAVVDIKMPPTHTDEGLRAASEIRASQPSIGVLILSQYIEVHYAMRLIQEQPRGAGYLLKDRVTDLHDFTEAIHRVGRGGFVVDSGVVAELVSRRRTESPLDALSERERAVLSLMAEGRSNQGIRERLFLSPRTVETHVRNIFMKMGLEDEPDDHRRVLAVLAYLRS